VHWIRKASGVQSLAQEAGVNSNRQQRSEYKVKGHRVAWDTRFRKAIKAGKLGELQSEKKKAPTAAGNLDKKKGETNDENIKG